MILQHAPADVLRWLLIAMGFGTEPTLQLPWPICFKKEPTTPDNCITVYDTSSQMDGCSMIDGEQLQHYGIQLRIRTDDAKAGYAFAQNMYASVNAQLYSQRVAIDSAVYDVQRLAKLSFLSPGSNEPTDKRITYTMNGLLALRRTA